MSLAFMLSWTGSASAAYRQFCWGVKLTPERYGVNGAICDSLYHDGAAYYINEIGGSGEQHSVCVEAWWGDGTQMCSSGPNKGVYDFTPEGKFASVGQISNHSEGENVAYGFVESCKNPCTPTGEESSGPPPGSPEGRWFLRNSNTTGIAENEFLYGGPELIPVSGDWNGDGIDTPGAYKPSTGQWFLRNSNNAGNGEIEFIYGGGPGMIPVVGDWNGDGIDTPGLYKPSTGEWFLRNSNTSGAGEINFIYGGGGSTIPIVGDWNKDGIDTIGVFQPASGSDWWYLRNSNTAGGGEINFSYGSGFELAPVVGDWNGDGVETPGLYKQSTGEWYLRNSNTGGVGEINFVYGGGATGTHPIVGDWNKDGIDTIGMVH